MAEAPSFCYLFRWTLNTIARRARPALSWRAVFFTLLLPALSLTACGYPVSSHAAAEQAAEQGARLQQLRKRIASLKGELETISGRRNVLQDRLQAAEKEIGQVAAELRSLHEQEAAARAKMDLLDTQKGVEKDRLTRLRVALSRELQAAYMVGKQERIKLLLNQEDPAAVGRMMVYHGYFSRARADRMLEIHAVLEELNNIETELIRQQADIARLKVQQEEKSARLAGEQDKRRAILARVDSSLKDKTAELQSLVQDEQRLQKLVQSLRKALKDIPAAAGKYKSLQSLKGRLRWPVSGRIATRYGELHAHGKLRSRGILIDTRTGTDVNAIAKGRIAFADWLRGFGLLVIIDHGDGFMSLYGQNRSLYKSVGEWVEPGELIAAAGNSGGQQQSGLYLELRKDGRPFDPGPWFAGKPVARHARQ
ncbi:MAG: peptidoglycan DD-metalloendopeptidase family protein [Gammaproteobacteria bacterium]